MASSSGKRTSSSGRTRKSTTSSRNRQAQRSAQDSELFHEIGLIVLFVAMLILFCCNFGIIGPVGNAISGVLFGIFGFTAYIAPIVIFLAVAFWFANEGNPTAVRKMIAGVVLFLMIGVVCDLITKTAGSMEQYDIKLLYTNCSTGKKGGGILAGSICYLLLHYLETVGTVLVVLLCSLISLILVTERSFLNSMRNSGDRIREMSREDAARRRENAEIRRQEQEERTSQREEMQGFTLLYLIIAVVAGAGVQAVLPYELTQQIIPPRERAITSHTDCLSRLFRHQNPKTPIPRIATTAMVIALSFSMVTGNTKFSGR
jgi:DNA segregation ATPase FtsK/SpoIIIE, S-DNA-T family